MYLDEIAGDFWDALRCTTTSSGLAATRCVMVSFDDVRAAVQLMDRWLENKETRPKPKQTKETKGGGGFVHHHGPEMLFSHYEIGAGDLLNQILGPFQGEVIHPFDDKAMLADLMVRAKKFSSKGQARKNGFSGPVPSGLSRFVVGKGKNRLDIWIANTIREGVPTQSRWQW